MDPAPLDATDASVMEESGFDVVRLPIAWSLLEPEPGHFSNAYLDRIASAVALLNQHHIYVVLDMHFLGWSPTYGGSGAPAWATVSGVPDIQWGPMPSVTRLLSPAINVWKPYFWLTSDWQTQYLRTWQFVATRFRDDSGVAGYDIINEPHAFPLLPLRFDKDDLFPFYARAITAIGDVDPNHLFLPRTTLSATSPPASSPSRHPIWSTRRTCTPGCSSRPPSPGILSRWKPMSASSPGKRASSRQRCGSASSVSTPPTPTPRSGSPTP